MPFMLFLFVCSVALQFYIYLQIRKHNKKIADEVFDGAWFKKENGHTKRVFIFYYNPLRWQGIKQMNVLSALVINFVIFCYILIRVTFV